LGHGRARQWGGAAEDGAESLELLGVQGSANTDKVDCVSTCEVGEKSSTELLHGCHIVGCQLTDGLQVTMALAGVLWRNDRDGTARLMPGRQGGGWGGRRLGACAAATAARGLGLRGATSLALLGWVGWENWEGDGLLGLLVLGVFSGCSHNCCQGGIGGSSRC
jgi:hypothetical protein